MDPEAETAAPYERIRAAARDERKPSIAPVETFGPGDAGPVMAILSFDNPSGPDERGFADGITAGAFASLGMSSNAVPTILMVPIALSGLGH